MKRLSIILLALTAALAFVNPSSAQSKKGVAILGDSYSTFKGFVSPESNLCWYTSIPDPAKTDVNAVSQTWWQLLIRNQGYRLVTNNSYSGATICNTGYAGNDYTDRSFITRMRSLGSPDIIYIFGGTNDDWAHVPLGEFKYSDWTKAELYQLRPATAYMLATMTDLYPGTEIVLIINSDLSAEVTESLAEIGAHYGILTVRLHDIDKLSGHPSVKGMQQIAVQIATAQATRGL